MYSVLLLTLYFTITTSSVIPNLSPHNKIAAANPEISNNDPKPPEPPIFLEILEVVHVVQPDSGPESGGVAAKMGGLTTDNLAEPMDGPKLEDLVKPGKDSDTLIPIPGLEGEADTDNFKWSSFFDKVPEVLANIPQGHQFVTSHCANVKLHSNLVRFLRLSLFLISLKFHSIQINDFNSMILMRSY